MNQNQAVRDPSQTITAEQEDRWRLQIRRALFVPESLPCLNARTHSRFEPAHGVVAERLSYGTQFDMQVPAILYLPKEPPDSKIPAFIVVNGHGGDKYSWYPFYTGILYARAGAVVLTYDPTGEGERNSKRKSLSREHDKIEPPDELAQRLAGLMITDLMQAISYLCKRPEVDATRIAAGGYSMGSFVLAMTGAIDLRLHAAVLVGGGNLDGVDEYWDHTKPMCTGIPYRSLRPLGDRAAIIYSLHASRGPTLIFNGLKDTTVNIPPRGESFFWEMRHRTVAFRGSKAGLFDLGFDPQSGHRPFFVTRPVALWLHQHLNFPRWTEAQIKSMPTTHISQWAAVNGVEMDPFYASEAQEGGTIALGTGIPGFRREDLHVFSAEEWERRKPELVHPFWREKARAQINV